jgi:RNA polymerase sigma-70 factor (ECF subfamily)
MNSTNQKTDSAILKSIIEGCLREDRKYQFKLYERYYGKMMGVCMRYATDRDEADDLVQQGFIKLFNNLKRYEFKGSFDGWIRRMFVNTSIDHIRRKKRNPMLLGEDAHLDLFNKDRDQNLIDKQEELDPKIVMEAIQKLTPAYKAVFNLYVIEDYSHKEISEMLGVSLGTSKSNLSKAKQNLRKYLQEAYNQTYE